MGANDPLRTTTEPGTDLLVASLTKALLLTLADRSAGGILANPVLQAGFLGRERLAGALAKNVVSVAWGVDKFVAAAEGTNATIYDVASDTATVTMARRVFARQLSDMLRNFDHLGLTQMANFVMDTTVSWQQSVMNLIGALFTSFTATGGNTGGAATWATVVADFNTLGEALVPGPYVLITRPKDWGNLVEDARALGGAVANDPEMQAMKGATNPGFKGVYMDGDLWVYTSTELPTSGGDTVSGMFGINAINWDAQMPTPSQATNVVVATPLWMLEIDRVPLLNEDQLVSSSYFGASIIQNAAGIQMPFLT